MSLRQTHFVLAVVAGGVLCAVAGVAFAAPTEAQKLITQNCEQCHEIKGLQNFGNIGPSLIGLKDRYPDRKEVSTIIFDETKRNPQTAMMPFGRNLILTGKEIEIIVDYLYAQ
jgi:L-cysteine S-thiosulfotransferase